MLIFKIIQCVFQGHDIIVITSNNHAYRYCLRCGKLETQGQVFAGRVLQPEKIIRVVNSLEENFF